MSKVINKLNKLKITESFFQASTIKGFKYIDCAGEIVNSYHSGERIPKFSMGLDGLVIEQPKNKIELLKITPTFIWAKFINIPNLGAISQEFENELEEISKIIEVSEYKRIGWRNYFVLEFARKEVEDKFDESVRVLDCTDTESLRLRLKTSEFEGTLMLQKVVETEDKEKRGVLFDVDLYKIGTFSGVEIKDHIRKFREYLSGSDFLNLLNEFFGK